MKYEVILADPPWSYTGQQDKWGAAAKFYPTMSDEEIEDLDVPVATPGVVFVWATGPKSPTVITGPSYKRSSLSQWLNAA